MTPDIFTTKVVGVSFCEDYPQTIFSIAGKVAMGSIPVSLLRDANNEYDQNAIRVLHDGKMIGHIPMLISRVIAPDIDAGNDWSAEVESIVVSPENPNQPGLRIKVWRSSEVK
jgi:HIRAN domain